MTRFNYLLWILTFGLMLSVTSLFCMPSATGLARENYVFLADARREDSVMREIRHSDKKLHFKEIVQPRPVRLANYSDPVVSEYEDSLVRSPEKHSVQLSPTVGFVRYDGIWKDKISGNSIGLLANKNLTQMTSLEVDFTISRCNFLELTNPYNFTHFGVNASFRLSLIDDSRFTPYISAGLGWNNYLGLKESQALLLNSQLAMGLDYEVTQGIRVGVRGVYSAPIFQTKASLSQTSAADRSNDGFVNSGFFRGMAIVGISL